MNEIGPCLAHLFGPVSVCSRGYRLMSMPLGDQPDRCAGRRLPGLACLVWAIELIYPSFFTSTSPVPTGLSFPFSRVELCFHPLSFYYLLFFTQAVGVTILSSSALHTSFLPHFPASLPYRFLTSSRHGKPRLARIFASRRYHCECL